MASGPILMVNLVHGFDFPRDELRGACQRYIYGQYNDSIIHTCFSVEMGLIAKLDQTMDDEEKNQSNIDEVVERAFAERGFIKPLDSKLEFSTPEEIVYLFKVKYEIESELGRIARSINLIPSHRLYGIQLLRTLNKSIIPTEITQLINDVWRICTPAIHGEVVTETQLQFVKKSYNEFMPFLKSIEVSKLNAENYSAT